MFDCILDLIFPAPTLLVESSASPDNRSEHDDQDQAPPVPTGKGQKSGLYPKGKRMGRDSRKIQHAAEMEEHYIQRGPEYDAEKLEDLQNVTIRGDPLVRKFT